MIVIVFLLISIPASIILWLCYDFRKYKKQQHFLIALLLLSSTACRAQYTDGGCSFRLKNEIHTGNGLECDRKGMTFDFIPGEQQWTISIENDTTETLRINWKNLQCIINGRTADVCPQSKATGEQSFVGQGRKMTEKIVANGGKKFYDRKYIQKQGSGCVTLIVPVKVGDGRQFFHTFDFIITPKKRHLHR